MPEELDPKKYHVMSPKQQKTLALILILISLIFIPVVGFFYYKAAVHRPAQLDREVTYQINKGEGINQIANNLNKLGALNSPVLFKAYLALNKLDKSIEAGVYTIPAGSSIVQLADIFQHGTNDLAVTFLEGWRVEEMALQASDKIKTIDYESFVRLAEGYEGYLFPDTYFFPADVQEKDIIDEMRKNFDLKTEKVLTEQNLDKAGLTKEEAIIFASIVEREVNTEEDRPIVAGILINRWKKGELIGADATTQYIAAPLNFGCEIQSEKVCPSNSQAEAINWWPETLTIDDLNIENPYNTRKTVGIPPSPISNPGMNAIESVINPQQTEYNYYLTDSEGITHYARTLDEHNQNITLYL